VSTPPPELDPDEAGCRPLLIAPPGLEPERLAAALALGGIAGVIVGWGNDREEIAAAVARLHPVCREHEVALLVAGEVELALELGADGLHLNAAADVSEARRRLGLERILGVACGRSRHAAMVAGEDGADYVAFGEPGGTVDDELIELAEWWSGLFVLPCAVTGAIDREAAARLARAGADFVGLGETLWHESDPAVALRAFQDTIASV
jgi:thiamine-phosphate pyrophosphorylase